MSYICPFTNNPIVNFNSYVAAESKSRGISKNDLKILIYEKSFNILSNEVKRLYLEENYSLPDFLREFKLPYRTTLFILTQLQVKIRSIKEAAKFAAAKSKITNLARYGVDQTFKVKEFDDKRKKTYMDRYGVSNPFEKGVSLGDIENSYLKKYGMSRRELVSKNAKLLWASKTPEERESWLNNSILSDKSKDLCRHGVGKSNCGSFLEKRVAAALLELEVPVTTQFNIRPYRYDFLIGKDLIVEVFGDYIHGNPEIFLPSDILPLNKKKVEDVWDRDKRRISHAIENGYQVVVIWESEIKLKNTQEILEILILKINENQIN